MNCAKRDCSNEFRPKREHQRFCSPKCRKAYGYDQARTSDQRRKKRPKPYLGSRYREAPKPAQNVQLNQYYTTEQLGEFIIRRIESQLGDPNPLWFYLPSGHKMKVWLAYDKDGRPKIGSVGHYGSAAIELAGPQCKPD